MDESNALDAQRKLTLKQRKWLNIYLETGNATQAAMQSYDCKDEESAAQIGYENLRKLDITELMEEGGITDKKLKEKLEEGLEATKVVSARVIVIKGRPTSQADGELPPADSRTDDFIDVPDYAVRHKYLETALKLKGRLGSSSSSVEMKDGDRSVTFRVSRGE